MEGIMIVTCQFRASLSVAWSVVVITRKIFAFILLMGYWSLRIKSLPVIRYLVCGLRLK